MISNKVKELTVFIVSVGETTDKKSYQAILTQTLKPGKIIFIRNVKGMHKAFNKVHKLVKTKFFCRVDADMILKANCLERLYKEIVKDPKIYDVRAFLKDPFLGKIGHIHLQRTSLVKDYVFKDEIACDRGLERYCLKRGYKHIIVDKILAIHNPHYSFEDIKDRFTREGQKIACFNCYDTFRRGFYQLLKLINKGNIDALIALVYLLSGLLKKDLKEKDYSKISKKEVKKEYKLFKRLDLDKFIEKKSLYEKLKDFIFRYIDCLRNKY